MDYKVIARKCRPQTFEEVIGQDHVTRTLKNAIQGGRIAHSFLFSGERGVGKTSVARILAKALNCRSGPTESPCGICASCKEITAGNCIDVHEIDGASNTGVDDIRVLRENVRYMPSRDRYKIYIIDEVHMLSTSAFNALLKTLEEPPEHVLFIFATTEPQKIPDTILSRCLRFDFKRIAAREIARHLESIARGENLQISPRGLFLIAREADGSMRDAQTLLERAISYCGGSVGDTDLEELLGHVDRQILYRILESVLSSDARGCIQALNEVYALGTDLRQFYFSFLETLRDLMMIKASDEPAGLVDLAEEDLGALKTLAGRVSTGELLQSFRLCLAAEADVTRSAVPRFALEVCLLEMVSLKRALPIEEALARIGRLGGQAVRPAGRAPAVPPRAEPSSGPPAPAEPEPEIQTEAVPPQERDAEGFIEFVRRKHPPTASKLSQGRLLVGDDGSLRMEFPAGSFFIGQLQEAETRQKLQAWGAEFFRKPVTLSVVGTNEKKKDSERDQKKMTRKKHEQSILHNPTIQKVIETFDGKIIEIKIDG